MAIEYRYNDGGYLEQQDPDGSWSVHKLSGAEAKFYDERVAIWLPQILDNELRTGLPAPIPAAIMMGEGAQPDTRSFDGGLGLMQITSSSLKQGLSDDEVLVPENNIRLGVDALAKSALVVGYDVPKLASMYNAGGEASGPHPSANAPWGYKEYKIPKTGEYPYISKVVRAYNYGIDYLAAHALAPTGGSLLATIGKVIAGGAVLGLAVAIGTTLGARR